MPYQMMASSPKERRLMREDVNLFILPRKNTERF